MKQFKHKKTGAEATQIQIGDYKSGNYIIPQTIIEDSSDWEEVKEKEYTILSFIIETGDVFSLSNNGEYGYVPNNDRYKTQNIDWCLTNKSFKIHSVRRQRDQEVFTLRDQMKALTTDSKNVTLFVEKIELIGDRIHLWGNNYSISLMCAEKAPIRKPILITEDKVEIYEGKILFGVSQSFRVYDENINKHVAESYLEGKKFFSTKEAAEEYIKWNKPMYSLREVEEARCAMCGSTTVVGNLLALKSWKEK